MKTLTQCIVIAIGSFVLSSSASHAATVSHLSIPGTEHDITDIAGFMTTGEDMAGMRVTAHFSADFTGGARTQGRAIVFHLSGS